MPEVVPLKYTAQLPEVGRIRIGVKQGRAMKAIDTFRFTSTSERLLHQLAALYGGEVRPWHDKGANPPNQFEVITGANELDVVIQPNSTSTNFELWSGGGCLRRCDGEVVRMPVRGSDEMMEQPCVCIQQGVRECSPKTRVSVLIPNIDFSGVWRYETGSEQAARTTRPMMAIIDKLRNGDELLPVKMVLEQRKEVKNGQTRHYSLVTWHLPVTMDQMLGGSAGYKPQIEAPQSEALPVGEGEPEPTPADTLPEPDEPGDEDIVDAEIVEEDDVPATGMSRQEAMALAREQGKTITKTGDGSWTVK